MFCINHEMKVKFMTVSVLCLCLLLLLEIYRLNAYKYERKHLFLKHKFTLNSYVIFN